MKKSRIKLLMINLIFITIISLLLTTATFVNKEKQERLLKKEIADCLNHLKDENITKRLATSTMDGSYKIVEDSIKKYLSNVITDMNEIKNILSDSDIKNILSNENLKNNKDNLSHVKDYIKETRYQLNLHTFKLISYLTNDGVMSFIDKTIDEYYLDLYKKHVAQPEHVVRNSINDLKMNVNKVLNYLDTCSEIVTFLENNHTSWQIDNNTITFTNESLLNEYNTLLEKI